jgi:hypothetical protein
MRLIVFIFLLTLITGCAHQPRQPYVSPQAQLEKTLLGKSADEIVRVWGIPDRKHKMDNGGRVMEYNFSMTLNKNTRYEEKNSCKAQIWVSEKTKRVTRALVDGEDSECRMLAQYGPHRI